MSNQLDVRLQLVASFVRPGSVVADIGTDHAYLPVQLVRSGVCPGAYACDLREGPLQNAKQTVAAAGLSAKIKTVLSDGLDALDANCADDVIFAGMGGILIAELLSRAAWLKNPDVRVIAQPMSHAEDVRLWLFDNGFAIDKEAAIFDRHHGYVVLAAHYTGKETAYTPAMPYGGTLFGKDDPAAKRLLSSQLQRLKKRRDALQNVQSDPAETARLCAVITDFERRMQYDHAPDTV